MSGRIANPECLAIGTIRDRDGAFCIRRVVWGWALARAEKRKGEVIRRVTIAYREQQP